MAQLTWQQLAAPALPYYNVNAAPLMSALQGIGNGIQQFALNRNNQKSNFYSADLLRRLATADTNDQANEILNDPNIQKGMGYWNSYAQQGVNTAKTNLTNRLTTDEARRQSQNTFNDTGAYNAAVARAAELARNGQGPESQNVLTQAQINYPNASGVGSTEAARGFNINTAAASPQDLQIRDKLLDPNQNRDIRDTYVQETDPAAQQAILEQQTAGIKDRALARQIQDSLKDQFNVTPVAARNRTDNLLRSGSGGLYNQELYTDKVPVVDDQGKPVRDQNGNIQYTNQPNGEFTSFMKPVPQTDAQGNSILDQQGKPVYQTDSKGNLIRRLDPVELQNWGQEKIQAIDTQLSQLPISPAYEVLDQAEEIKNNKEAEKGSTTDKLAAALQATPGILWGSGNAKEFAKNIKDNSALVNQAVSHIKQYAQSQGKNITDSQAIAIVSRSFRPDQDMSKNWTSVNTNLQDGTMNNMTDELLNTNLDDYNQYKISKDRLTKQKDYINNTLKAGNDYYQAAYNQEDDNGDPALRRRSAANLAKASRDFSIAMNMQKSANQVDTGSGPTTVSQNYRNKSGNSAMQTNNPNTVSVSNTSKPNTASLNIVNDTLKKASINLPDEDKRDIAREIDQEVQRQKQSKKIAAGLNSNSYADNLLALTSIPGNPGSDNPTLTRKQIAEQIINRRVNNRNTNNNNNNNDDLVENPNNRGILDYLMRSLSSVQNNNY